MSNLYPIYTLYTTPSTGARSSQVRSTVEALYMRSAILPIRIQLARMHRPSPIRVPLLSIRTLRLRPFLQDVVIFPAMLGIQIDPFKHLVDLLQCLARRLLETEIRKRQDQDVQQPE